MKGTVSYRVVDGSGDVFEGEMDYSPPCDHHPDWAVEDEDDNPADFDELDWTFRVRHAIEDEHNICLDEPITGTIQFHLTLDFEYEKCGTSFGAGKQTAANEQAALERGTKTVDPDAPIWRIAVLYGITDPRHSDPRLECVHYFLRANPAQLTSPLADVAYAKAARWLRADGIVFDPTALRVAVEETNLHIVTRDGVDVMEERPAPPDAPRVAGYAKD